LDSTLASPLAQSLLKLCPSGSNNTTNLDVTTPTKFDAAYFRNLQVGLGLLTSDAELQSDGSTSGFVSANTNFNTFASLTLKDPLEKFFSQLTTDQLHGQLD
jgi:peroxidase